MPEEKALATPSRRGSAIAALASRLQVNEKQLTDTLKATAFRECRNDHDFLAAVIVANTYGLNPLLKEMTAFPGKNGGVIPVVEIDGWISIVNRQPEYDGVNFKDHMDEKAPGGLAAVTCIMYRKDRAHPIEVTEYMSECHDSAKSTWQRWPRRMLRHKAYIQCARVAFGIKGIYDPDEKDRIIEGQLLDEDRGKPNVVQPLSKSEAAAAATAASEPAGVKENEPKPEPAKESAGGKKKNVVEAGGKESFFTVSELLDFSMGQIVGKVRGQIVTIKGEKTPRQQKPYTVFSLSDDVQVAEVKMWGAVPEGFFAGDIVEFSDVEIGELHGKKNHVAKKIVLIEKYPHGSSI